MIKKLHACSKMNFSSNINEVMRKALNSLLFFFLQKDFPRTKKHQNAQKRNNKKQKMQISEQNLKMGLKNI